MNLKKNVNSDAKIDVFEKEFWNNIPRNNGVLDESFIKQEMWDYFCTMYNSSYIIGSVTDCQVADSRTHPDEVLNIVAESMNEKINSRSKDYIALILAELD